MTTIQIEAQDAKAGDVLIFKYYDGLGGSETRRLEITGVEYTAKQVTLQGTGWVKRRTSKITVER